MDITEPIGKTCEWETTKKTGSVRNQDPKKGYANHPEFVVIQLNFRMGYRFFRFAHGFFRFSYSVVFCKVKVRNLNSVTTDEYLNRGAAFSNLQSKRNEFTS